MPYTLDNLLSTERFITFALDLSFTFDIIFNAFFSETLFAYNVSTIFKIPNLIKFFIGLEFLFTEFALYSLI